MADAQRSCWIEKHDGDAVLHLAGAWQLAGLRTLSPQLDGLLAARPATVDGAQLQ